MRMFKLASITLLALLCTTGCIVRGTRTQPRPPPGQSAPTVQRMNHDEAVSRATQYASSRGYTTRAVKDADLKGGEVWKVKLEIERPGVRGKLHMEFDAWSREILRADEQVKSYGGRDRDDDDHHGHGRHDDDDDDRRERGREHRSSAANEHDD